MAERNNFFSRIQLTFRRSNNVTKIVVIAAIALSMFTLIALRLTINAVENRTEELRRKAAAMEIANEELQDKIDSAGSIDSVVEIAEEELGLVQPGSVVLQPES